MTEEKESSDRADLCNRSRRFGQGEGFMKKMILTVFLLCAMAVNTVAAGELYPLHNRETRYQKAKTQRYHVVFGNLKDVESHLTHVFQLAGVAEDADVRLYPIVGKEPDTDIRPTEDSIRTAFERYVPEIEEKPTPTPTGQKPDIHFETTLNRAVEELAEAEGYEKKTLLIYLSDAEEYRFESLLPPEPEPTEVPEGETAKPVATEPPTPMELLIQQEAEIMTMQQTISAHPEIYFLFYDSTGSIRLENSFTGNFGRLSSSVGLMGYAMNEGGYQEMGVSSYTYDRKSGKVTIKEGKANTNLIIYAFAKQDVPVYIGGGLASGTVLAQGKKQLSGVSLGYHHMNFLRTVAPRRIAMALFTIDTKNIDLQKESFSITVKNADEVLVYHTASQGSGVFGADVTYDSSQDDAIENRYFSQETPKEEYQFFEEENGAYDPTEGTKKRGLAVLIGLWAGIAVISVIAILIHVKRRR